LYQTLGQYEKSLADYRAAQRLSPNDAVTYSNLIAVLVNLNRVKEARATVAEAQAKKLDSAGIRFAMYQLGFLQSDDAAMAEQSGWGMDRPGDDAVLLYYQADTAAYYGQLNKARDLSKQAIEAAQRAGRRERAAGCEAAAGLREALFGNGGEAKRYAFEALKASNGKDVQFVASLAWPWWGPRPSCRIRGLSEEPLPGRHHCSSTTPDDLRTNCTDRWQSIAGDRVLNAASRYELGLAATSNYSTYMYPVYFRGRRRWPKSGRLLPQNLKILNWPGVVSNEPIGALHSWDWTGPG
jgi:tetratricopeptide (TPR) repeat protein